MMKILATLSFDHSYSKLMPLVLELSKMDNGRTLCDILKEKPTFVIPLVLNLGVHFELAHFIMPHCTTEQLLELMRSKYTLWACPINNIIVHYRLYIA